MAWRAITEDDITADLLKAEIAAFRQASLVDGQTDPLTAHIARETAKARGYIAGCSVNRLGPDGTLPEVVIGDVVAIIRFKFLSRIGAIRVSTERVDAAKEAKLFLKDVARCEVSIEKPAEEAEEGQSHTTIEVVSEESRRETQNSLKGL